jgi:hypothetical protein
LHLTCDSGFFVALNLENFVVLATTTNMCGKKLDFSISVNVGSANLSTSWGYTRDAAIRPNKLDRLRAEFWLFSLVLPLLLIESPFQPRLRPEMRLEITGSVLCVWGNREDIQKTLTELSAPERRSNELVSSRIIERC